MLLVPARVHVKGGEKEVRKILFAPLALCTIALSSVLFMPAVWAEPMQPLMCEVVLQLNEEPNGYTWFLTITGDIVGTGGITLIDASFPGITEHYCETWHIDTDQGIIEGYQEGVWSFKSFEFKSNGYVTVATEDWEYLLGSDMHVRGVTTDPNFLPLYGTGIMWMCGFGP